MKRITTLRLLEPSRCYGGRARMSSFVEAGTAGPYNLPLILLSTPIPPPEQPAYNTPQPMSLAPYYYQKATPRSEVVPFVWPSRNLQNLNRHVTATQYLPPIQLLESIQLRNEVNTEPPKEGKPKWEEEQYPDIGKTIDIVTNHLPFLLIQPLPKSVLSSKIELRLFPSTHPSIPPIRLGKLLYRTFFRSVRWLAPIFLNRSLRSFGSPSGIKGIGLEITCLRVTQIENGRRIEARWRTSASPWSNNPSSPSNTAEQMPRTWSGWFYFDINRKGLIVRHVVENVNNHRTREKENKLKDILVRTVQNGRALGQGFAGSVDVQKERVVSREDVTGRRWMRIVPRIFPSPSPSNIFVSTRPYC